MTIHNEQNPYGIVSYKKIYTIKTRKPTARFMYYTRKAIDLGQAHIECGRVKHAIYNDI